MLGETSVSVSDSCGTIRTACRAYPEDSRRLRRWSVRFERGADSDFVDPAGNQVEHAGRSQVNVIRSSNSGIERIVLDDRWEGERFPLFPVLRKRLRDDLALPAGARSRGQRKPAPVTSAKPSDSVWRARNIARRLQITEEAFAKQGGGWLAAVAVEIVLACIAVQDGQMSLRKRRCHCSKTMTSSEWRLWRWREVASGSMMALRAHTSGWP